MSQSMGEEKGMEYMKKLELETEEATVTLKLKLTKKSNYTTEWNPQCGGDGH